MANINYDSNARYDSGPNAAGTSRITFPPKSVLVIEVAGTAFTTRGGGPTTGTIATTGSFNYNGSNTLLYPGQAYDTTIVGSDLRSGFSCAGNIKNNPGPHVAGAPRSFNNT